MERSVLPGGLRVITEAVPGSRSAAFGIWVGVGARDEAPAEAGASHFLEHLLFKGTTRRTALEIASVIDAVGGELNAFTEHEYTCYHATVLDEDLPLAVDVVCDLVTSALVAPGDVDSERDVIVEEISMHDDDPGDVVHDAFAEALYGDHPLGRPVIGSVVGVKALTPEIVAGYYRRGYLPSNMVVSVAGNLSHDVVVQQVLEAFGDRLGAAPLPIRGQRPPEVRSRAVVQDRPTEQAHLVLGMAGLSRFDPRRYALAVLGNALGGGMSSRLFQEVRERRGLAYSVYSSNSYYQDTGSFEVYVGCTPARVDEVLAVCREQLQAAAVSGLTDEEFTRSKGQLRGSLVLDLEDVDSKMSWHGATELMRGDVQVVDDVLAAYQAVTPDDVRDIAAQVLHRPLSLGIIGPFPDRDFAEVLT